MQTIYFTKMGISGRKIMVCPLVDSNPKGVFTTLVYGGVHMNGKIQTQKYGLSENFAPQKIGILHISYPKIWAKIVF